MDVLEKKTKAKEASLILKLSYPQILRLKNRVKERGEKGLLRIQRESKERFLRLKEGLRQDLSSFRIYLSKRCNLLN